MQWGGFLGFFGVFGLKIWDRLTVSKVASFDLTETIIPVIQTFAFWSGLHVQLRPPAASHKIVNIGAGIAQSSLGSVQTVVLFVLKESPKRSLRSSTVWWVTVTSQSESHMSVAQNPGSEVGVSTPEPLGLVTAISAWPLPCGPFIRTNSHRWAVEFENRPKVIFCAIFVPRLDCCNARNSCFHSAVWTWIIPD